MYHAKPILDRVDQGKACVVWIDTLLKYTLQHLIDRLCVMDDKEETYCKAIKGFVDRSLHKRSAEIRDACFRQPHFHVGSSTTHPTLSTTDVDS